MAIKEIFIHAGNPKAYSTSLQYCFYKNHNVNINYQGFIPQKKMSDWYDSSLISELLNFDLRVSSKQSFKKNLSKYSDFFFNLSESNHLPIVISSENILMRFTVGEIDVEEKLDRLSLIFQSNFKVNLISIYRPILDSIISIYKEYLKNGYTEDFQYFQKEIILFKDANFIYSLFPTKTDKLVRLFSNFKLQVIYTEKNKPFKNIKFGLKKLIPSLEFNTKPFLNSSNINVSSSKHLMKLNKIENSFVDTLGMLENHRILWHLSDNNDFKLQKLYIRKKSREKILKNISSQNIDKSENKKFVFQKFFLNFIKSLMVENKNSDLKKLNILSGKKKNLVDYE